MKKSLLSLLVFFTLLLSLSARETIIPADKVTPKELYKLVDESSAQKKYFDDEGDLKLLNGNAECYCLIKENDRILRLVSSITSSLTKGVSSQKAFELCNKWNRDQILCSVYYNNNSFHICCYLPYEGGLNSITFNDVIQDYYILLDRFCEYLTENNAL